MKKKIRNAYLTKYYDIEFLDFLETLKEPIKYEKDDFVIHNNCCYGQVDYAYDKHASHYEVVIFGRDPELRKVRISIMHMEKIRPEEMKRQNILEYYKLLFSF